MQAANVEPITSEFFKFVLENYNADISLRTKGEWNGTPENSSIIDILKKRIEEASQAISALLSNGLSHNFWKDHSINIKNCYEAKLKLILEFQKNKYLQQITTLSTTISEQLDQQNTHFAPSLTRLIAQYAAEYPLMEDHPINPQEL